MSSHVYSADEAQRILHAFPSGKLNELLKLAAQAKYDPQTIKSHERILLPEGWEYEVYGNCIIARYQDGEQERRAFFAPQILIEFEYTDTIEAKKSVVQRFALGYCSCGKRMPFVQGLLWAIDMAELKGIRHLPARGLGYTVGFFLALWVLVCSIHQYSLTYNRHPNCL